VAEQSDTPKILEELSRSNNAKGGSRTSRQQKKARRRVAVIVGLFLLLLVGVMLLAYQQRSLQIRLSVLTEENQQLNLTLTSQGNQLQQVRQELAVPAEPIQIDDASMRELESSMNTEIQRLRQQLSDLQNQQINVTTETDFQWKVLEAEYLLGMAYQKVQLEANSVVAITLLESADAALVESGSSNVFAVRQAIAGELLQLHNVQPVDLQGIFIRLDNLADQADTIDLLSSMRQNFQIRRSSESQSIDTGTNSTGLVDSTLTYLGSIFVWRNWEDTPEAMLVPGQETYIKQNLRLLLEQSQLALLMRDQELFQRSLANSRDWLQRYAVIDTSTGQTILAGLNELMTIDIDPPLPSISRSLDLVKQLTASER